MTKIYQVDKVDIVFQKKNPPNLLINAVGTVSTGGWSDFNLSMVQYIRPPEDGIQEFTFDGKKPTGIVTEALEPGKTATATMEDVDVANHWGPGMPLIGVRVTAETNAIEEPL